MDSKLRCLPPEVLLADFCALLQQDESVEALPVTISGNSMAPFLVHGRDTVYLSRITQSVKKGDVVLYRRQNGSYILHRVHALEGDTFTMAGDAHSGTEPGIRRDQLLAIMTSARRKGRLEKPGSARWEFFARVWPRLLPLRRGAMGLWARLKGGR